MISHLQTLWDCILDSDHAKGLSEVFAYFGWWFNTLYFEDHRALDHLGNSLLLAKGKFEPLLNALACLSGLAKPTQRRY